MSTRPGRPGRLPALLATAALVGLLAGCGGGSDGGSDDDEPSAETSSGTEVDPAAQSCRDQWRAVSTEIEDASPDGADEDATTPSSLRSRYTTVEAQIDYYATSATADDCGETLTTEQAVLTALTAFREQLAPYDVERRLATFEDQLDSYARPEGEAGTDAPRPARVTQALEDLRRLAPQATAQQAAAWQQAAVVDVQDAAARRQAVADLEVVSGESQAYQRAQRAVAVLDRAVAATDGDG